MSTSELVIQCVPCKEAGVFRVAVCKEVVKARSHDGQYHPPMCYEHKNNRGRPVHSWQGDVDKVKSMGTPPAPTPALTPVLALSPAPAPTSSDDTAIPLRSIRKIGKRGGYTRWTVVRKQVLSLSVGVKTVLEIPHEISNKRFSSWLRQDFETRLYKWTCEFDQQPGKVTLTRLTDVPKDGKFSKLVKPPLNTPPPPQAQSQTQTKYPMGAASSDGIDWDGMIAPIQTLVASLKGRLQKAEALLEDMARLKSMFIS